MSVWLGSGRRMRFWWGGVLLMQCLNFEPGENSLYHTSL
jgi:hypothetical protein